MPWSGTGSGDRLLYACGSDTSVICGEMQTISSTLGLKESVVNTLQILGTEKMGSTVLPILI